MNMAANIYPINAHRAFVDYSKHPNIVLTADHVVFGFIGSPLESFSKHRIYQLLELYFPKETRLDIACSTGSTDAQNLAFLVHVPRDLQQAIPEQMNGVTAIAQDMFHVLTSMSYGIRILSRKDCRQLIEYFQGVTHNA